MYPAYTWTNSYPMHSAPNEDPRAKELPFHMKMDSPYQYQPWSYSCGSYSYPVPHQYHSCCNHNNFGAGPYGFHPPYPHYPLPTLHARGVYPPFPGAYPAYSTPQPHYSVDQPRYDYDKDNHTPHHCCGCNDQEKEKSRVVLEEPKVDKKTSESMVPLFLKDSPYPIMWVPPSKENERKPRVARVEPEVEKKTSESLVPLFFKDSAYPIMWVPNTVSKEKENEKKSRTDQEEPDNKISESLVPLFLKDSPYPIMWVPPNGNMNTESKAKENEKKSRVEQEEPDKKTNESLIPLFLKDSPYPIMWLPSRGNMNEELKAKDKDKRSQDSVSLKNVEPIKQGENGEGNRFPFPIFWLPSKNNEVGNNTKDNNLDLVAHKLLPDENKRHGSDSEAESETHNKHVVQKVIPVKQMGKTEENKSIETKKKSDLEEKADSGIDEGKSSPKTSKLPPVCLRIDPLPRKKKTSRSPSPPGVKDRSKSIQQETHLPESLKEEEQSKGNIKTIDVSDANKVENNRFAYPCENVPISEREKVEEKKNMSEQEAALMIQSAYRGFEVRKSQPLTKLRKIGEVTEQVVEIRNRIRDMESSSSTIRIDNKQKLIIGETIMSLLLKLDTIQGLHPIVRDVRKSVAKELVGLQEKLDSLTSTKSETQIKETVSSSEQVMHLKDDAIEEKSDQSHGDVTSVESGSGLSGNHGVDAKDSHDDGCAEAYNTNIEPQSELRKEASIGELNNEQHVDDVIQQKFDQALTQSDSTNEAIDFVENGGVEIRDMPEQLVEFNTGEFNNNQIQMSVETDMLVYNSSQEKCDHGQAESDSNHEDVGLDTVINEDHEVEVIDSVDNNGEVTRDTNTEQLIEQNTEELDSDKHQMMVETEQPLDNFTHEKSDKVQAESVTVDDTMKSETEGLFNNKIQILTETDQAIESSIQVNTGEVQVESGFIDEIMKSDTEELNNNMLQMLAETEQAIDSSVQEKSGEVQAESGTIDETMKSDTDICEHHKVESAESYNDGAAEAGDIHFETQVELESQESIIDRSHNLEIGETEQPVEIENPYQTQAQFESDIESVESAKDSNIENNNSQDVSLLEPNVTLSKEDSMKGIQEDLTMPMEEAPKADDVEILMEDVSETSPASPGWSHVTTDRDGKLMKDLEGVPSIPPTNDGDRKLMEENEKLRVAVEELLKAGNEQLGVIKELTGRVKDLEKKLSKKNKKIKVNKCRSRVVQDELSDCLV